MEKQHLKRFGYGFSALVMALSAANFFPLTGGVQATANYDACPDGEDVSACFVEVTAPSSLEYTIGGDALVFSGNFNGNLIVHVDGEPYTEGFATTTDAHTFTQSIEFSTAGSHEVKFLVAEKVENAVSFTVTAVAGNSDTGDTGSDTGDTGNTPIEPDLHDFDYVSKVINVNDSFTVKAVKNGTISALNVTDEPVYSVMSVDDSASATDTGDTEDEVGFIPEDATEDQITITESAPGEYDIMALEAGRYLITIAGFDTVNGVLTQRLTSVYVMAVGATTESATTITDIMNNWSEADKIAEKAWADYEEVMSNPDSTEEDIQAAYEAFREIDREAFANAELKEKNAFGDDADAIRQAVYEGKTISTKVAAESVAEADLDEDVKDALLEKLDVTFASNVKFYDIDVVVYADGEEIGTLKELTGQQVVVLSGFEGAAAGFNRVFKVLGYHTYLDAEGNEQVEIIEIDDVEFDETTGSIIFGANKFSTYTVAYKDVLAASVDTGAFTGEGASASASVATSVVAAIAAIALFGAFKFAKTKRN